MKNPKRLAVGLLAALLAGCAPVGVSAVDAHEILLYGPNERHVVFYGSEQNSAGLSLDGKAIKLSEPTGSAPAGSLAVPGTLWVDGKPTLQLPSRGLGERFSLSSVPVSGDVVVNTRGNIGAIAYYNGRDWYSVTSGARGDTRLRYSPTLTRNPLRGLGQLTDAEADALARYLAARGPVAVGVLDSVEIPDPLPNLQPSPRVWQRTALVVQTGVPVDVLGGTVRKSGSLEQRQLVTGGNSAYCNAQAAVNLDTTLAQLRETWAFVGGNQVPPPAVPNVDFNNEKVVTFFLGQKPTGGFGVTLGNLRVENSVLVIEVTVRKPGAGAIVTQSLTSPFLSIAVGGLDFTSVRVVDSATGQTLATGGTSATRAKPCSR